MTEPTRRSRPPLTLIANAQEWHSRALASVLGPEGYAVLQAYTGKQAIERAVEARPDLIFVDTDLPDRDGLEVVKELRQNPHISSCTPIIVTSPGHPSRQRRIDAFRAGAWDYIGAAIDGDELPLRLAPLVRAKMDADRLREDGLLDEQTGLYSLRGLARRAREVGALAFRRKEALACIVVTPLMDADRAVAASVAQELAQALRSTGRTSDIIGTLGPDEFAIIAGGTDAAGVERLAERLADAADRIFGDREVRVAFGYDAVANYSEAPIDPADMITRASVAMRKSRSELAQGRRLHVRRFEQALN